MIDEHDGPNGERLHYMKLAPDVEALIRDMADAIRALRDEVHLIRVRQAVDRGVGR